MQKKALFLVLAAAVLVISLAGGFLSGASAARKAGLMDSFSGPLLLYPVTDNINLAGKDALEFRWKKQREVQTRQYIFRLYKGYNMLQDNLLLKQDISIDTYPIPVPAKAFETNQVYTWSLQQVFLSGLKSEKSFSSFKVVAK